MDMTIVKKTAAALAAVDVSEENAKLAELRETIAKLDTAIQRGERRAEEIGRILRGDDSFSREAADLGRRAAGDALLQGASTAELVAAGATREALEAEKGALAEGLRDLRRRRDDAGRQESELKKTSTYVAGMETEPLIADIMRQARDAVEALFPLYASLSAIHVCTRHGWNEQVILGRVLEAAMGEGNVAPRRSREEVPAEVVAALRNLTGKGDALHLGIVESVQLPPFHMPR